ncbi:MAG: hypothetical protein GXO76_01850 [Calditrichaeota bacterium]|nr:hypothetical protein [Calditrichota bacterium]
MGLSKKHKGVFSRVAWGNGGPDRDGRCPDLFGVAVFSFFSDTFSDITYRLLSDFSNNRGEISSEADAKKTVRVRLSGGKAEGSEMRKGFLTINVDKFGLRQ